MNDTNTVTDLSNNNYALQQTLEHYPLDGIMKNELPLHEDLFTLLNKFRETGAYADLEYFLVEYHRQGLNLSDEYRVFRVLENDLPEKNPTEHGDTPGEDIQTATQILQVLIKNLSLLPKKTELKDKLEDLKHLIPNEFYQKITNIIESKNHISFTSFKRYEWCIFSEDHRPLIIANIITLQCMEKDVYAAAEQLISAITKYNLENSAEALHEISQAQSNLQTVLLRIDIYLSTPNPSHSMVKKELLKNIALTCLGASLAVSLFAMSVAVTFLLPPLAPLSVFILVTAFLLLQSGAVSGILLFATGFSDANVANKAISTLNSTQKDANQLKALADDVHNKVEETIFTKAEETPPQTSTIESIFKNVKYALFSVGSTAKDTYERRDSVREKQSLTCNI